MVTRRSVSVNRIACGTWEALSSVELNCSVPVNFFKWGSCRRRVRSGPLAHTLNYFVMSCPVFRYFTSLSFGNKFSLKITKLA